MGYGYQKRDKDIIDYKLWTMDGFKRPFRGPKPDALEKDKFFVCLGAAQTFGCYTEQPFPELLSHKLAVPVFNLGHAGAGPSFYLNDNSYFEWINKSAFAIVQVMSGRSESNSYFISPQGRGRLVRITDGKMMMAEPAYSELLQSEPTGKVSEIIKETRENYIQNMESLLKKITVPKILLWFSERSPDYIEGYADARELFGKYPQLVNPPMLDQLVPLADAYVEAATAAGMPQKLCNRFTGKAPNIYMKNITQVRKFNAYYPSPEMHREAYEKLFPVCNTVINKTMNYGIYQNNLYDIKKNVDSMVRKQYLFIGGVGRSGTSALTELIGSHPLIVLGMERYNKLFRREDFSIKPSHFEKERFLNILDGDTFYTDFSKFRVHKDIPEKWEQAKYVGVKYPQITQVYDLTKNALGDIKVIYIYRNIFDVAESWNRRLIEQTRWPKQRDYKRAVSFWNNSLLITRKLIRENNNIICLKYEDVFFSDKSLLPVFEWLGLDMDEEMLKVIHQKRKDAPIKKAKKSTLPAEQNEYIQQNARFDLYEEFNTKYNVLV